MAAISADWVLSQLAGMKFPEQGAAYDYMKRSMENAVVFETNYNTEAGIEVFLQRGLAGFHELVQKRRDAGYDRKERMREFVILGRWALDGCGNLGKIDQRPPQPKLAPVLRLETIRSVLPDYVLRWTLTGSARVPTETSLCEVCGRRWTLENAHEPLALESPYKEDDKTYMRFKFRHVACHQIRLEREERVAVDEMFRHAGFVDVGLNSCLNQYDSNEYSPPWFNARTPYGVIKVGWRKRVINIDWSDTGYDATELFKDQDVTKDAHFIHAWGWKMGEEYLSKLLEALKKKEADGKAE